MRLNQGFTLIELVVSLGVLGIALSAGCAIFRLEAQNNARTDERQRIELVRSYVRGFFSCSTTMVPSAIQGGCKTNAPIDIRDRGGNILVGVGGTLLASRFRVTDRCNGDTISFAITDQTLGDPQDKDLFDGIPIRCPLSANAAPSPSPSGCFGSPSFVWLPSALQNEISTILPGYTGAPFFGVYRSNPNNQNPPGQPFTCMTGTYASPVCQSVLSAMARQQYGLNWSFTPTYMIYSNKQWEWFPWYLDFLGGYYYQYAGLVFGGQTPYGWRFDVSGFAEDMMDGSIDVPSVSGALDVPATLLATGATTGPPGNYPLYQIPLVVLWPNIANGDFAINITPVNALGQPVGGRVCGISLATESPIVLDFSAEAELHSVPLLLSQAFFDLTGEGIRRHSGWVPPTTGFLALDLNGNGTIDSGQELFGNHTYLPDGQPAQNGYLALAQYDLGKRGSLDATDPIFDRLVVWTDENGDGISQPSEIRPLRDLGVTRISTRYERVPEEVRKRDRSGNSSRYRSRFWGPSRCGDEGCRSYDIYFQTER